MRSASHLQRTACWPRSCDNHAIGFFSDWTVHGDENGAARCVVAWGSEAGLRQDVIQGSSGTTLRRRCAWLAGASILTLFLARTAVAGDATLSWSPNTESDVVSYRVHYGPASGTYDTVIDVGLLTTYTVTGLSPGTYYFAVTAHNLAGAQSGFSNEVSKLILDTAPPVISLVAAASITTSSAAITWATNEPSTSLVEYGTSSAYGLQTTEDLVLTANHEHRLTGLQPSTLYHYRVVSRDESGNVAASADRTFTTTAADTTAPTISSITTSNVTSTSATVTWTTNEAATTQVQYGSTSAYGSSTALNTTLMTQHSQALTGLATDTTYHFRVLSRDAAGNLASSGDVTVSTVPAPDTTAPTLSAVAASGVGSTGGTITWTSDEPATTQVQYGTTTAYGSATSLSTALVTSHSQGLNGLVAATTYHYRVLSRDAAGNQAASGDFTLTTLSAPDTTAPTISGISTGNLTSGSATISWLTDEPATTQVTYGATTAYGSSTPVNTALVSTHGQTLTGLTAGTTYHFRVISRDASGNQAISGDFTMTTLAADPVTASPSSATNSDTTAPVISRINVRTSTTGALVGWRTDEPATSMIEYGTTTAYGSSTTVDPTLVQRHRQSLDGLTPESTYHFRIRSIDAAGNVALSPDRTFSTSSSTSSSPSRGSRSRRFR